MTERERDQRSSPTPGALCVAVARSSCGDATFRAATLTFRAATLTFRAATLSDGPWRPQLLSRVRPASLRLWTP